MKPELEVGLWDESTRPNTRPILDFSRFQEFWSGEVARGMAVRAYGALRAAMLKPHFGPDDLRSAIESVAWEAFQAGSSQLINTSIADVLSDLEKSPTRPR